VSNVDYRADRNRCYDRCENDYRNRVIEDLASATGGRAFFPFKMKDISRSFASIEEELRSQYAVSYKPSDFDADGRYRSIEITALKKDLQVRARRGYYAPRQ